MRKIILDVKTAHYGGREQKNSPNEDWIREKRVFAMKTINNATILSEAVTKVKNIAETSQDSALKEAIEKIDSVIEEMRGDFKKNYVL